MNGPDLYNNDIPVQGFTIHPDTGSLLETWAPHDVSTNVYIIEKQMRMIENSYKHLSDNKITIILGT